MTNVLFIIAQLFCISSGFPHIFERGGQADGKFDFKTVSGGKAFLLGENSPESAAAAGNQAAGGQTPDSETVRERGFSDKGREFYRR